MCLISSKNYFDTTKQNFVSIKHFVILTKLFDQNLGFTQINNNFQMNKSLVHPTKMLFEINQTQLKK